jgi:PPP family 3-phenylpropionic acid transporter
MGIVRNKGDSMAVHPPRVPYWRLSSFYLFYFASLGALVPYWGLFLKSRGLGAKEIGGLFSLIMVTKVVAPNVWGWIADHRGERMVIVRWASLLAVVAFSGVFWAPSYGWLALVMLVFSFFWNATLPQLEALTMTHLREQVHRYTRIRLWGSIGFILTAVEVGPTLDRFGVELLPSVVVTLMGAIWLASLRVPERKAPHSTSTHESLRAVLIRPKVLALLTACFLMLASHGPYYAFFSIYLEGYGYRQSLIGQLWALGVMAEVVLYLVMPRLLSRFPLHRLFLLSFALTALRWTLIGLFPEDLFLLVFAQILHAASFGVFHAVAIQLIHRAFVGPYQGRGQALYSSLSFGAGGALGSLLSGYAWESLGPTVTYLVAALVSGLGFVIVWRWIGRVEGVVGPV